MHLLAMRLGPSSMQRFTQPCLIRGNAFFKVRLEQVKTPGILGDREALEALQVQGRGWRDALRSRVN